MKLPRLVLYKLEENQRNSSVKWFRRLMLLNIVVAGSLALYYKESPQVEVTQTSITEEEQESAILLKELSK